MGMERRDSVAIRNASSQLSSIASQLESQKQKILNDVDSILSNYVGPDASSIVASFKGAIEKINPLISNIKYNSDYMKSVANYDAQNVQSATSKINSNRIGR